MVSGGRAREMRFMSAWSEGTNALYRQSNLLAVNAEIEKNPLLTLCRVSQGVYAIAFFLFRFIPSLYRFIIIKLLLSMA